MISPRVGLFAGRPAETRQTCAIRCKTMSTGRTLSDVRTPRSVRLVDRVDQGVQALARRSGRDVSAVVNEMLDEGLKMRRIPGIVFGDTRRGRVARLAGTGLAVYEVIRTLHEVDDDPARLRAAYHWLTEPQIRAVLAYAEAYPDEIDQRLSDEADWTAERVWETYPFMRPQTRA